MEKKTTMNRFAIVVVDRGWIYVGDCEIDADWCVITNARNIRRWGTSAGLGELAAKGPQENTRLDDYGTVRIPMRAVITVLEVDKSKWSV